ncbi:response regulator [Mucilaginibacter sp. UYCu711]|uniref:response regulator n=1 Tax=Mucilaginibacter sp. UYCu711 TaxID=3156339 RepID=UPI003D1D6E2B
MNNDNPYKNCLLIDDNLLDNSITIKMIERANFAENFVVTHSPEDALKMLREKFITPDLVFVDIRMRIMNGFDFIEEYRKIGINRHYTKIFILSSSLRPADIQRATKDNDITGYILKTLTDNVLLEIARMKSKKY